MFEEGHSHKCQQKPRSHPLIPHPIIGDNYPQDMSEYYSDHLPIYYEIDDLKVGSWNVMGCTPFSGLGDIFIKDDKQNDQREDRIVESILSQIKKNELDFYLMQEVVGETLIDKLKKALQDSDFELIGEHDCFSIYNKNKFDVKPFDGKKLISNGYVKGLQSLEITNHDSKETFHLHNTWGEWYRHVNNEEIFSDIISSGDDNDKIKKTLLIGDLNTPTADFENIQPVNITTDQTPINFTKGETKSSFPDGAFIKKYQGIYAVDRQIIDPTTSEIYKSDVGVKPQDMADCKIEPIVLVTTQSKNLSEVISKDMPSGLKIRPAKDNANRSYFCLHVTNQVMIDILKSMNTLFPSNDFKKPNDQLYGKSGTLFSVPYERLNELKSVINLVNKVYVSGLESKPEACNFLANVNFYCCKIGLNIYDAPDLSLALKETVAKLVKCTPDALLNSISKAQLRLIDSDFSDRIDLNNNRDRLKSVMYEALKDINGLTDQHIKAVSSMKTYRDTNQLTQSITLFFSGGNGKKENTTSHHQPQ
ncbi:MAG: hypothetical protein EP298_00785 [Gammaproteobacteria bacterium]|nr:MAG: hypothetical protein EP298_00785 [Gammaproteobacteria bacterium]UTW41845.1 hypothetical protein KFE69_10070 [bacterium SCSIO 12844]